MKERAQVTAVNYNIAD